MQLGCILVDPVQSAEDNLKAQWTDRVTAVNTWLWTTNREGKRNGYGTVQRTGSQSAAVLEQVRDGQYLLVLVWGSRSFYDVSLELLI